jgi:hypothetical protein
MMRSILGPRLISARFSLFLLALPLAIASCERPVGSDRLVAIGTPRKSPSGEFSLALDERVRDSSHCYVVSIRDGTDAVVFAPAEKFITRHSLFLCWADGEDVAWCYSGDLGIYYWKRDASGAWVEAVYDVGGEGRGSEPPAALKALRPSSFSSRKG